MKKIIAYILFFMTSLCDTKQPITLFCHGIIDNKDQINHYKKFIKEPAISFDFPDAQQPTNWDLNSLIFKISSFFGKRVNRQKMFMGTDQDIQTLHHHINPEESYILYGFSRGGSAAINYLGKYNPKNVRALIIEAAPADMIDSITNFENNIGYRFTNSRLSRAQLFNLVFPAYQIESKSPIENIRNINNKNLPILIVHAHDDARVSINAGYKIYQAFKQAGCTDVYFCQLDHGIHAHYTTGPEKNKYLRALHSFYKQYGFAYNQHYATLEDLTILQPTINEISKKIEEYNKAQETIYEQKKFYNQKLIISLLCMITLSGIAYNPLF